MSAATVGSRSPDLLQAFLDTNYLVRLCGAALTVRIGRCHAQLDARLQAPAPVRNWAIFTACNPQATQTKTRDNRAAHQALLAMIRSAAVRTVPTVNQAADGGWPDEPGLLLCNPDPGWLQELSRHFGQLGLVHAHYAQSAELWLYGHLEGKPPPSVRVFAP